MSAGALSITDLYSNLEKASNPELAGIISKAFEQVTLDQKSIAVQTKEETLKEALKEINEHDLATKGDVLRVEQNVSLLQKDLEYTKQELELKIYREVSTAKWQVIGSIAALFFLQIIAKHFGY